MADLNELIYAHYTIHPIMDDHPTLDARVNFVHVGYYSLNIMGTVVSSVQYGFFHMGYSSHKISPDFSTL